MFVAGVCVTVFMSAKQKVSMTKVTYSGFVVLLMAYKKAWDNALNRGADGGSSS